MSKLLQGPKTPQRVNKAFERPMYHKTVIKYE